MPMTLESNGKKPPNINIGGRRNESIQAWSPNNPPPPGYGIVYAIQHYHMNRPIGIYIGYTRRSCKKRWSEHLNIGLRSLLIGVKPNTLDTYQYQSSDARPLYGAIAIAEGRHIINNFHKNFSFHIMGLYTHFKLENAEHNFIKKVKVGNNLPYPKSYKEIRYVESYNLDAEPQNSKLPSDAFYRGGSAQLDFNSRIIALADYLLYESSPMDTINGEKSEALKVNISSGQDLVNAMSTFVLANASRFQAPGSLRTESKMVDAISRVLKLKIVAGSFGYLMYEGKAHLTFTSMRIMLNTVVGSASGKGKKGQQSAAMTRIGGQATLDKVNLDYMVSKNNNDPIFSKKTTGTEPVFSELTNFYKKSAEKTFMVVNAEKRIEDLTMQLIELIALNISKTDPDEMNSIQEKINNIYVSLSKLATEKGMSYMFNAQLVEKKSKK